ncbi:hypothetical protein J6590_021506 [Homalodisca vitripennis]|nr:hypothetical protein J6590_021506 [Homalodisca vitripennis]
MSSDSDIEVIPVIKDIPIIEISDDADDDIEIQKLVKLVDVSGNSDECYETKVDRLLNACNLKAEIDKVRRNGAFNDLGPFYIDRRLVPVNIYQEGLIINMWNPETLLEEICHLCRWTRPTYKALHFIPTGGFRCSVWVNGVEFIPTMLARTPASGNELAAAHFLQFLGFHISMENLNLYNDWEHIDKAKLDMRLREFRADLSSKIRLFKLGTCGYEQLAKKRKNVMKIKISPLLVSQCQKSFANMNSLFHMLRKRLTPLHSKDKHFLICTNKPQRINIHRNRLYDIDMKHRLLSNTDCVDNTQLPECNQTFSLFNVKSDIEMWEESFDSQIEDAEKSHFHDFDFCVEQDINLSTTENMYRSSTLSESYDLRQKLTNKVFDEPKSNSSYLNACHEYLQSKSTLLTNIKKEHRGIKRQWGSKTSLAMEQKHFKNARYAPKSPKRSLHSRLGIKQEQIKIEGINLGTLSHTKTARNASRSDRSRSPILRGISEHNICNIKQEKC